MEVRYSFRLRPGATAEAYLWREWGRCRWVWNQLVAESRRIHQANLQALAAGADAGTLATFGYAAQDRMLTGWRQATEGPTVNEVEGNWLAAGSSVAQQQTVRDFAAARSKAVADRKNRLPVRKRRGLPTFKSKHRDLPTVNYTRRGFSLLAHPDTGRQALKLPGGTIIPVVWSRELPSDPKSARVSQDSMGHWQVSFVVDVDAQPLADTPDVEPLGVDWGVTEVATTTDDTYDLAHDQAGKKAARRLARYQRMMARRKTPKGTPDTAGYRKAKRQTAKAHKNVARQRADRANKWAKQVVANHDRIAVEDFQPKFLAHTSMARKAADARIAGTKHALVWQARKHRRDLRLVDPKHTTMDCAGCGVRAKHRLPLSERTYTCTNCGQVKPRDKNSAAVMVNRAFGPNATVTVVDRAGLDPADADGHKTEPAAVRAPAA